MTVEFRDGQTVAYSPPAHTGDPRYKACADHHTACDCREAWLNEEINEYRSGHDRYHRAIREILADHDPFDDDMQPRCRCTGCQILQRVYQIEELEARSKAKAKAQPRPEDGWPF